MVIIVIRIRIRIKISESYAKVSDFLAMEGVPESHDRLKQRGLLHEWNASMYTIRGGTLGHLTISLMVLERYLFINTF